MDDLEWDVKVYFALMLLSTMPRRVVVEALL